MLAKLWQRLRRRLPREDMFLVLAATVMMIPAWVKGINLLILLSLLVLSLFVVNDFAARRQLRRLEAKRRWLGPIFAGVESEWEVEISNPRPFPSRGMHIVDSGPEHCQQWFVPQVPARSRVIRRAAVSLPRRGRYLFEPLQAVSSYPFGFARTFRSIGERDEIVVLPALGRLQMDRFRRWLQRIIRGDNRLHRLARPSMIHQDDLHGLRPFRLGDNPRWIHWRTSARRNQRMVREFEEDTGQNLIVVFEPWQAAASGQDVSLENALSLAATIVWEWSRQSSEYLMLAIGGDSPLALGGFCSRDQALTMLRSLAEVAGTSRIDAAGLIRVVAQELVPEAPVLLITPRRATPVAARLAAAWNRTITVLTPESAAEFYDPPSQRASTVSSRGERPCRV